MVDLKAAFELLDIAPSTDEKIVRKAWRALVRSYHPDMAKTDPAGANKRLAEINAAFDAVCACTAEEVQRLRAEAARRQRIERNRARAKAYIRRGVAKARSGALDFARDADAGTGTSLKLRDAGAGTSSQARGTDERVSGRPRTNRPKPQWSLAAMADNAFRSARIICGPQKRTDLKSYYL